MRYFSFFITLILMTTCGEPVFASENLSFASFYSKSSFLTHGYLPWILAGVVAVGAGAAIFFSGGTATPVVTTIGTWIGNAAGLSGIAATNFGLALLGGGAIAAGGLGKAGGIALLTAALTFSVKVAPDIAFFSYNYIQEEGFDRPAFEKRIKNLPRFPLPRSKKGTKPYKKTVRFLKNHYVFGQTHLDPTNQKVVDFSIFLLTKRYSNGGFARNETTLSLLYFHQGNYLKAKTHAEKAMEIAARQWAYDTGRTKDEKKSKLWLEIARTPSLWKSVTKSGNTFSLPAAVWAVSSLANQHIDLEKSKTMLEAAIAMEEDNTLSPLTVSLYISRLLQRADIDGISLIKKLITSPLFKRMDSKSLMSSYAIIATESLVAIKLRQALITFGSKKENASHNRTQPSKADLKKALTDYNEFIAILNSITGQMVDNDDIFDDKKNKSKIIKFMKISNQYSRDSHRLQKLVSNFVGNR